MKKIIFELIGTFALVFLGCGSVIAFGAPSEADTAGLACISLTFGLTVTVLICFIGKSTGCHINPAITISMLVANKISTERAMQYIIGQFAGATLAAGALYVIWLQVPGFETRHWIAGSNGWGEGYGGNYNFTWAMATEAGFTFLLMLIFFIARSRWGSSIKAALAIGLAVTLIHLAAFNVTGASVNPARSFGSAIFGYEKNLSQLWLFIISPIGGAILAALVWTGLFEHKHEATSGINQVPG